MREVFRRERRHYASGFDVGTFTKVVAIDLDKEELVGVAQAASTVDTDITIGLHAALRRLGVERLDTDRILSRL